MQKIIHRYLVLLLCAMAGLGTGGRAWAQTWTVVKSTDFTTAPNTAAPGAGGVLYDGWIDFTGGSYKIAASALNSNIASNSNYLLRPASENTTNERQTLVTPAVTLANAGYYRIVLRWTDSTHFTYCDFAIASGANACSLSGGANNTGASGNQNFTGTNGHSYSFDMRITGTSAQATLTDVNTSTVMATASWTDASNTTGRYGVLLNNVNSPVNSLTTYVPATPALATSGNIQFVGANQTSITLSVTTTGGTAPYTYTWQRALVTGSTIGAYTTLSNGSGVAGATSATLTDASSSLIGGNLYVYKATIADSASTPASVTTYSRPAQLGLAPLSIVGLGDSTVVGVGGGNNVSVTATGVGQSALANCADILRTAKGYRNVTVYNQAIAGSASANWTGTGAGSNFGNALAACGGSFAGKYVFVRLGVNDAQGSVSAATFQTNMTNLIANIVSNSGIVLLDYPMWREPGLYGQDGTTTFSESTTLYLLSYLPILDALVNNSTVYAGDKKSLYMTMQNPQAYFYYAPGNATTGAAGAIHESALGTIMSGANEAQALLSVLYPATGATASRRFIH